MLPMRRLLDWPLVRGPHTQWGWLANNDVVPRIIECSHGGVSAAVSWGLDCKIRTESVYIPGV